VRESILYTAKVFFASAKPVPLAVWSGMYLYRELLNLFESQGVRFNHSARKPFYLSPILADGKNLRYIVTGALEPGEVYWFRFSTASVELVDLFRASAASGGLGDLRVVRIEETVIDSWGTAGSREEGLYLVRAELRFAPTLFRFRGHSVLYPSPARFFLSLARDIYEVWGVDLLRESIRISMGTDVASMSIRTERLYIGRDAGGRERYVEGFAGRAVFVSAVPAARLPLVLSLLRLSEAVGVGKNRALGLGFVSVANVEVKRVSKSNKRGSKQR